MVNYTPRKAGNDKTWQVINRDPTNVQIATAA